METKIPENLNELLSQLEREGIEGYDKYLKVKKYIGFKCRTLRIPVSGVFELTPLCNFNCKMCYVHLDKNVTLLTAEQWKSIIDDAYKAGMLYATLTGGECLTYMGFKEIYLHLYSLGIKPSVLTNGSLINNDILNLFCEYPPSVIQVTVYGASDDGYEAVTGKRAFDTVVDNIDKMLSKGLTVKASVTVNPYMTDGVKIIELLEAKGIDYAISPALDAPRADTGRKYKDISSETYIDLLKAVMKYKGKPLTPVCEEEFPEAEPAESFKPTTGLNCGAGRNSFTVTWNGKMLPCTSMYSLCEDILTVGFEKAWQSTVKKADDYVLPVECESCKLKNHCFRCAALHLNAAPGHVNEFVCQLTKQKFLNGIANF